MSKCKLGGSSYGCEIIYYDLLNLEITLSKCVLGMGPCSTTTCVHIRVSSTLGCSLIFKCYVLEASNL